MRRFQELSVKAMAVAEETALEQEESIKESKETSYRMKRDLKINYGVLKEVVESVKRFQTALEEVKAANERFEAGLGDYESKAVTSLREQYGVLLKEMESCEEELTDIHKIFSDYIADMTVYIKPVSEHLIMRVSRNDIYWNINSMDNMIIGLVSVGAKSFR